MNCEQWLKFLQESISDDGQRVELRAWMKKALSPNDRPDQALLIVGSGLGKSTFARLLAEMAPGGQVSTINNFTRGASSPEIGEYGINICEIDQIGMIKTPSILKAIIDGDAFDILGALPSRISLVFVCNYIPLFFNNLDFSRFLTVVFNNVTAEKDRSLVSRLLAEKDAILEWAQGA